MFGKNTVASTLAFLLDLAILWGLVELVGFSRVPAAIVAFAVPMVLFYILEREWVFPGTKRGVASGFVYFMINIGIGFLVMLAVFWGLLLVTDLHYLIARVAASVVSGIVIFILNGVFNFKQL
jgi:putative flippase GtrA